MDEKEELYRFEVILYKDSLMFGLNFPEPAPFIQLPNVYCVEEEEWMDGLKVDGWGGRLSLHSKPRRPKAGWKPRSSEQKVNQDE